MNPISLSSVSIFVFNGFISITFANFQFKLSSGMNFFISLCQSALVMFAIDPLHPCLLSYSSRPALKDFTASI